jgi:hypothetical protein
VVVVTGQSLCLFSNEPQASSGGGYHGMPIVRIEHAVPDFSRWKQAFDNDPADRQGSGVRRYQVFRQRDEPNNVFVDLEFDTASDADAFLQKMQLLWAGPGKAVMLGPRAHVVERVESREL